MQLLRKATFMQHLMLGPPAIVANKWARRVLCVGWMAFEVYSAYRAIKTQPKAGIHIAPLPSGPVVLYRQPNLDHETWMTANVKVRKVYTRPFGMHATHYWVPGRGLGRSYVVRELGCSHSS